jgi:hypothetical protein
LCRIKKSRRQWDVTRQKPQDIGGNPNVVVRPQLNNNAVSEIGK